jgi:uncharacterized protein involved in exopolysaccharide biosynthesis
MQTDNSLSLTDYLAAINRRRVLAMGIAVPVLLIGAVLALALPDIYRSYATFRLVADRVAEQTRDEAEYADQYIFSLADKVLRSESLGETVVASEAYPEAGTSPRAALAYLYDDVTVSMVTQTVLAPGTGRERTVNTGFQVAFQHRDPEQAERLASALAQSFIEVGRSDDLTAASNKAKFFSGEADRLSQQIADFERRLADFKAANFDRLPESAQANVGIRARVEQELDGVEREIRTLQQNRVFVAQQLRQAQTGPAAGNLRQLEDEYARKSGTYADTHPDMVAQRRQIESVRRGGVAATGNSLQAQLDAERAILAEARQRYSEDHPDIRRMQRNIETLEARIAAGEGGGAGAVSETVLSVQLQTQLNAIDTQIGGLQARAGGLRSRLEMLESQLGSTPEVEREYQEITRGLGGAREQYNQMMNRRLDAEVQVEAINSGAADRFTLFAAPTVPSAPSGPPRAGILVISVLLSLILAFSAVVAAEALDATVRGARDVRAILGSSPLAVIPEIHNSLFQRQQRRRLTAFVGSVIVGAPLLFLIVRLLAA